MRIWDIAPERLCRQHLLGEHRELHAMWTVITEHKKGYSNHPETKRWIGKLHALYVRHSALVKEMTKRGYAHHSDLDKHLATGSAKQTEMIHTIAQQEALLRSKHCNCQV